MTGRPEPAAALQRAARTTYHVAGAPDIYTVLHRPQHERGVLTLSLSPGLTAYSFTFG